MTKGILYLFYDSVDRYKRSVQDYKAPNEKKCLSSEWLVKVRIYFLSLA
jgi:hypothetical protein